MRLLLEVAVLFRVVGSILADESIWPIPMSNGRIRWMTEDEAKREAERTEVTYVNPKKFDTIKFFLFTQANPVIKQQVVFDDSESLSNSNFNSSHPTRFIVHGWRGDFEHFQNKQIRKALLLNGRDENYNVFVVDWSVYADTLNYFSAKSHAKQSGVILADFIDWLHEEAGLRFESVHLIGHSLGAHAAGFAGKCVKRGRVHTIIGLDPAMPLFEFKNPENRLSSTDAEYVETIHTNGRTLGFYQPIGKAAFYPNGGQRQAGCGWDPFGACSHRRPIEYYAEAIALGDANGYVSVPCKDFDALQNKKCSNRTDGIRLGDGNNFRRAKGVYYLKTRKAIPYGTGNIYSKLNKH